MDFDSVVGSNMKRSPEIRKADAYKIIDHRMSSFGENGELCGSKWDQKAYGKQEIPLVDLRYRVGSAVVDDKKSVTEVTKKFGVSRGFVSRYAKYYRSYRKVKEISRKDVSKDIFRSVSNRPKEVRPIISKRMTDEIIRIRKTFPFFGSAKIRIHLRETFSGCKERIPCLASIDKILRKHGLMDRKKNRVFGKTYGSFERKKSLDLLQIDYKDWGRDESGKLICSIWVLDDSSRAILGATVSDGHSTDDVIELLEGVVARFGKPKQILSDHGTEFYSIRSGKGNSKFDIWCKENGIEHIMGRVKHPQTQGKIERSHGSAIREILHFGKMDTLEHARETIMRWIEFYNTERPHQAIDYEYPLIRFFTNLESMDSFVDGIT